MSLLADVRDFITRHGLIPTGTEVVVGFSGGPDSTCLLLVLAELGFEVSAVHLNHGLRPTAERDACWCRDFCVGRGIPFVRHCLTIPAPDQQRDGVEQAARNARLRFWQGHVSERQVLALGHHADDAVETLLLRLDRGSNVSGLVALRPQRRLGDVCLIRPLLCVDRLAIESYLSDRGVCDWCEDETNVDTQFLRNAVRRDVVPILSRVFGGLAGFQRSLEALAQDAVYLEAAAREVGLPLTGRDLVRCPPALLPRVLRDWLCVRTGQHHLVRRTGVERLRQALGRLGGREELVPLGNGLCVAVSRTSLRMAESVVPLPARSWTWQRDPVLALPEIGGELRAGQGCPCQADLVSRDPDTEWFAPASLPGTLVVRSWQPGDRMVPFGGRTPRKLQDLFVNAGIPRGARSAVPVVVADSVICWVAGVRRSRIAPVAADEPAVCFRFVRSTG